MSQNNQDSLSKTELIEIYLEAAIEEIITKKVDIQRAYQEGGEKVRRQMLEQMLEEKLEIDLIQRISHVPKEEIKKYQKKAQ